jgi:hypothetical protein
MPPGVPRSQYQLFAAKLQEMEGEVRKLNQEHAATVAQNRMDVAAQIKKERDAKATVLERFKQAMAAAVIRNQQQQLQHARSSSQGRPQSANLPAQSNTQVPSLSSQMSSSLDSQDIPRGPDPQALIQLMQSRTGTNQNALPAAPGFHIPPNVTPEIVNQMQKLVENRGIRPPQPSSFPQNQLTQHNEPPPIPVSGSIQQQTNDRGATWEGSLTWTGFDVTTHDRKELHAQVKVASPTGDMYVRCGIVVIFVHSTCIMKHACDVATQLDVDAFKGACSIGTGSAVLGKTYQGSAMLDSIACQECGSAN